MSFKGKTKLNTPPQADSKLKVMINQRNNNTSGVSPLVIRITQRERQLLQEWLIELQQHTNKRLTGAKLIRGMLSMKDSIKTDKLIDAILENT